MSASNEKSDGTMRITIAGDIGSGKTTVAALLGEAIGVTPISTGLIQRRLAADRQIDILQLNKAAEIDPSIDAKIDRYLTELLEEKLVVESRMAWHFVPNTLKIFLYASYDVAVERILPAQRSEEAFSDTASAKSAIVERRLSELKRFKIKYGVDISNLNNYDLVIDSTFETPSSLRSTILNNASKSFTRPLLKISPLNVFPTQSIREVDESRIRSIASGIAEGTYSLTPISVVQVGHEFYVVDGHHRLGASISLGHSLVDCTLIGTNDEPLADGTSAREYARSSVFDAKIYDWEDAMSIRFTSEPWRTL